MTANPFASGSKLSKMAAVYNGFLCRNVLMPMAIVYETLSREHGVSVSSVKRYITHIKTNGYQPKEKNPRPLAAWDAEALEFFKRFYLMASRDAGRCTVRNAYRQTVLWAGEKGLRVGSEPSAYIHAREIHAALKLYVKGGNRALDNLFYIARDLSSLRPFQIVVGDQHRFDFWVADGQGGYFRPECYLWLDMRTRLVYGISFDRNYNTRTVLRALKQGVERFGKFESTYNDNGSGEKSAVADYTIEQLQNYGMKFCDEGDLYRTETGAYVVEGADGKMVGVARSRAEWKKQNRRIFANVKNAKTKPIERFFSTLEQILRDMILPGLVTDPAADAAAEEESNRRLEWQKQKGYILPFEEFVYRVIEAVDRYEHREHGTLKRSPMAELEHAANLEGWRKTAIDGEDLKYLFLERGYATVRGDRVTLAGRQFIGPNLTRDMVKNNRGNLAGLNRRKVELRYDPDNLDGGIWAVDPGNNEAVFLTPVTPVAMLDEKAASAALEQKRKNMKAVRETYNSIAGGTLTLFEPQQFQELRDSQAAAAGNEPSPPVAVPAMTDNEFGALVAAKISVEPNIRERSKLVFLTPRDRYESLRITLNKNQRISAADLSFMADYESKMTDGEEVYFSAQSKLMKQGVTK
jgi:putative transposase